MTTGSINPDTIGFLFDLDGVIIDSESEYTRIWHAIDQKFPTGVENFEYVIKGRTLTEILDTNIPHSDTQPKVTEMLKEMEETLLAMAEEHKRIYRIINRQRFSEGNGHQ